MPKASNAELFLRPELRRELQQFEWPDLIDFDPTTGDLLDPEVYEAKLAASEAAARELNRMYRAVETAYGVAGKRALCLEDRFYLLSQVLHRLDAFHPWIYAACREVEAEPDGCLDLWARESYKSSTITFAGSIQEILRNPEITIGIFSHTRPDAQKFVVQIKSELETNAELKALFPDILYARPEVESPLWSVEKGITVKRSSNAREATVEGHGVVDSQPVGSHFALMIFDDLVTALSVSTPDQVNKTSQMHALADSLGARGIDGMKRAWHIGTRYHFRDTYQDLLDRGILKPRVKPATHNGLRDGRPVFLSAAAWAKELRKPTGITAAQMLQNPAAGNEKLFKTPPRFLDIRPATLTVAIMCDPASSRKKGSDSTVIHVWGMDVAHNRFLLDGYHHKMSLSERWQKIRDLRKKWLGTPGVQMVKVGYERFGLRDALDYFEECMLREGISFEIIELAWPSEGPGSKYDRIQRLEPELRDGKIILAAEHIDAEGNRIDGDTRNQAELRARGEEFRIWKPTRQLDEDRRLYSLNKKFLEELMVFPFAPHDDALDTASRWYDMAMQAPIVIDQRMLEPEVFEDGS